MKQLNNLKEFFNSTFWIDRFKKRMEQENESYIPIQLKIILEVSSNIKNYNSIYEFSCKQYKEKAFRLISELNKRAIGPSGLFIKNNSILDNIDSNEFRHKLIPAIKEMYDNKWTEEETYELSKNLSELKNVFTKDYIINLLKNIL